MYRPLPPMLTIRPSAIDGLGLFATEDVPSGYDFGMSHFYWGEKLMRTPLGGFINHSDTPNCIKMRTDSRYFLTSIKDIKAGEEITLTYTFYTL